MLWRLAWSNEATALCTYNLVFSKEPQISKLAIPALPTSAFENPASASPTHGHCEVDGGLSYPCTGVKCQVGREKPNRSSPGSSVNVPVFCDVLPTADDQACIGDFRDTERMSGFSLFVTIHDKHPEVLTYHQSVVEVHVDNSTRSFRGESAPFQV